MSSPPLVIDAAAALHAALARTQTTGLARYELVAPPLFLSERTSALSAAAFRGAIPASAVREAFDRLEAMPVTIVEVDGAHRRQAMNLAKARGWAKTYDAEYIVLAVRLGCPMLTTDRRMMRGAQDLVELIDARSLG